jgi:peptide/nickel transport system substrate-binding protein/oligopeptide transport system substrate-binding protein
MTIRAFLFVAVLSLIQSHPWDEVSAQDKGRDAVPQYGGTYRRPLSNNPSSLDPAVISDIYGFTVAQQIFDGLVQYDGTVNIVPAIAENWKGSRDGLNWTFYLRKGVKFHNGREVVADDVVYSFTRILDPRTKSNAAEVFLKLKGAREFIEGRAKSVQGLRALDRHTVEIELSEASGPLVASLAMGYIKIVPREAVESAAGAFGLKPIGTGPFKFANWKKDEEIVLEANESYYGGRPFLERLIYRIYPGAPMEKMFDNFEHGELEDTFVPGSQIRKVQEDKRYQFVRRPILSTRFLGINTASGSLSNPLIRQAFSSAIDREAIVKNIHQNRYRPAQGILPPGTYGYDPNFRPFPYDPERAKALLAKAGYPGGKGLPVIDIWSSVKSPDIEREHEAFKKYLGEAGIRVELKYHTDWPQFKAMVQEGKLAVFRWSYTADVPDPDNFLYNLFSSKGKTNITAYRNPSVDRLLDRGRTEQDYIKRVELYRQAERLTMEDAPVFPINYSSYERLFQPYVKSIEVNALGDPYIPMRKIWLAK